MAKFGTYTEMLNKVGVAYIGSVAQSAKLNYSFKNGVMTYGIYLAPSDMSGHNVCPCSKWCRDACLNGSGHNKADILHGGYENSQVNKARILKTRLFYEDRPLFMALVVKEIMRYKARAERLGMGFSIRLNCTSDLSPELFIDPYSGYNLLERFEGVQFYDYTKVSPRLKLIDKYKNYDLTFSHDGHNWDDCKRFLDNGGKAAVVFKAREMPRLFDGYKVEDGNLWDMRYLNSPSSVIHLHYHVVANDYKIVNGKRRFVEPFSPFIIEKDDARCIW